MLDVDSSFRKSLTINATPGAVYAFLVEYETSMRMVPGIDKISKTGDGRYRWVFKPIGPKGLSIRPEYETQFASVENKEIRWESIPGKGNADVKGRFTLKNAQGRTRLELNVNITAHLPLPGIMKFVAGPAMDEQTRTTMERFLRNIKEHVEKG